MNLLLMAFALFLGACGGSGTDEPIDNKVPEESSKEEIATEVQLRPKAPLYWSVYEYCWKLEKSGMQPADMDINDAQWNNILSWVEKDLKPYGYDMVCTDGFIPMLSKDDSGYMTHYGSMPLTKLVEKCKEKGIKLGVYDNPLWIHGSDNIKVKGINGVTIGDLRYKSGDKVINPSANDKWFGWIVSTHKGAKEYIDGFFKHYSDMGVNYIRMDFLSWYEDGNDRGLGTVGKGYGRESYKLALKYICESASKYKIFTSLVMPHLKNDGELEAKYGNMVRIVADTGDGGWGHFSSNDKGKLYRTWPNAMNMFDGFVYWSKISGRKNVILDGDFIRLNTFSTDAEKESVISLQLLAGGPVTVADQPNTIGDNLKFYQNKELLALNKDGLVGKPLSTSPLDKKHQIWYGKLSSGDWIVGFFNRNDSPQTLSVNFSDLGVNGDMNVRDLWNHKDEGAKSSLSVSLSGHQCKIVRLSAN